MDESAQGVSPKEQEPTMVSVGRLIELTQEKRDAFDVDKDGNNPQGQEQNIEFQKIIRANTDPVLARLKELQEKRGDSFASLEKLIDALNELAPEDDPRRFPNVGDEVFFNVAGRVLEIGMGGNFIERYIEKAFESSKSLRHLQGSNTWDNPPEDFPKTFFYRLIM